MRKSFVNVTLACVAILLLFAINILAEAPTTMVYQGRLADADGNPIINEISVVFSLYEAIDVDPSVHIWTETLPVEPDDQGVFTVELGTGEPLTADIFNGDPRFLGIKVGDDPEMIPRQLLASAPYAINSNIANGSVTSTKIADGTIQNADIANSAVNGAKIANGTILFADIGQNSASTDQVIKWNGTAWTAATDAGGTPDDNSVTSAKIADGTILNADINNSAAISASKISGTAATLSASQKFTGTCTYGDSSMIINNYGIRIGDPTTPGTATYSLVRIERKFNEDTEHRYGLDSRLSTTGNGGLIGVYGVVNTTGSSPGTMYGVYGGASGGSTNYAGYFSGNVQVNGDINVTGSVTKSACTFKIDHPIDPANKYLIHSVVESPDMMNVYNGNIITDASGYAIVELPDYFDALNKDFRYQLTVIGDFAQAIVGEEISGNQFTIRTDKPSVKVSWQVTGIRKDAFAEANRIQVEVEKPANEKGLYLHPEVHNLGPERQIHYQMNEALRNSNGDNND